MWSLETTGRKRSLPLLGLLGLERRPCLHTTQHESDLLFQVPFPPTFLRSSDLEQNKSAMTLSAMSDMPAHYREDSVSPVTTACLQAPGSPTEVERLCLMKDPTLVTPALCTETVYKFLNMEQGQGSFCFLPQISYSMKVKCPHEGSQPGLIFCS